MRILAAITVVLILAGCAGQNPGSTPPGEELRLVIVEPDDSGGIADGPGVTVAEAIGHEPSDDIVLVTGALFIDADGTVRLCEAIAESFPPQCGGERIVVEGLDLGSVGGIQEANGVRWAEAVTLLGSVE